MPGPNGVVRALQPPTSRGTAQQSHPPVSPLGSAPLPLTGHTGLMNEVAFSPDGTLLATTSDDGKVWLWDPATHTLIGEPLTEHTGRCTREVLTRRHPPRHHQP
ncbi:WD40 repeat domain-containing protein [Streptomyces sp. NPDC002779]|uniref:WD40 repeat domain-containing protein n=1 Tax=Streptomyces sp. NPDC002779 TaxID=3364664 RepID=UPI00367533A6